MDWQQNIVQGGEQLRDILVGARRVAVLGIKTERQSDQPAFYVPEYLARAGLEVIPIPVYYPEAREILGRPVHRRVADVPGDIDILDVFRRPADIPAHLDDIIAKKPRCVWFQSGIRHDEAAERLAREGMLVVQSRCLMVDHQRYA